MSIDGYANGFLWFVFFHDEKNLTRLTSIRQEYKTRSALDTFTVPMHLLKNVSTCLFF